MLKAVVRGKQLKNVALWLLNFCANFSVDEYTVLPLTEISSQVHN